MAAADPGPQNQPALFALPSAPPAPGSLPPPASNSSSRRPAREVSALLGRAQEPQDGLFDTYYYDTLVPADHELMQIDQHVDFSFVSAEVEECYSGVGRPPIQPELMLRLCFLKEYTALSDGELVDQVRYNLLYRKFLHLGGNALPPDSSSLTVFRQRLGSERVARCLQRVVEGAVQLGLVSQRRAHVDSTGVAADAATPRPRTLVLQVVSLALATLKGLTGAERLVEFQAQWATLDADSEYWRTPERRDAHLTCCWALLAQVAGLYDELMAQGGWTAAEEEIILEQADLLERVAQRQHKSKGAGRHDTIASVHDADARWSNSERGKKPFVGYKHHITEDADSGVITAVNVTPANTDDSTQLLDLLAQHEATTGAAPESVAADSKYHTGPNRQALDEACTEAFIAVPAAKGEKQGLFSPADFDYDAAGGCVMCPAGQVSELRKRDEQGHGWDFTFLKAQCLGCALRERCTKREYGRTVFISDYRNLMLEARAAKDSPDARQAQVDRLAIERTFAFQKLRQGLRRTHYRGLEAVTIGVYFNVFAVNIRRIVKLLVAEEAQGLSARTLLTQAS